MSRLDELIKELCPNGVEYKELGEIAKVTIGEFVHKDKQSENAEYPVFNGGISNTGYYNDYNEEKDKIIMSARGANAGYINRVFVNYWAGNSCYTINTNDEIMNWNFLYYVLKNKEKNKRNKTVKQRILNKTLFDCIFCLFNYFILQRVNVQRDEISHANDVYS